MTKEKIKEHIKINVAIIYDYHICVEHLKQKISCAKKEIRDLRKLLKDAK